jgi:hypothetical protein
MAKKQQPSTNDTENVCASCGMAAEEWSESYKLGSKTYCCQGCAEQTGCTCSSDARATA